MFQASEEAILFHGLDGKIIDFNRAAAVLFGSSIETSKPIDELIVDSDVTLYWSEVYAAKEAKNTSTLQLTIKGPRQAPIKATAQITRLSGSNVDFCVTLRDISRKKEVESRVSELYATISHEMRTPLTSIYGALSTLDENPDALDSHMGREMISIARRSTERILRLVNEILDFRKMESGGYSLNLETIAAEDLLLDALSSMQSFADSRHVRLVGVTGSSRLGKVLADRDRVLQTLCNLISNAIKHSDAGKEVQIRAHRRSTGMMRFAVSDNGAGIEADEIPRLFEKYYQAERLDGGKVEGTGLGLAICKSIVEAHGGSIGCDSRPASGSTFWFELRAVLEKEVRPDATMTRPALSTAGIYCQNQPILSGLSQLMSESLVPHVVLTRPGEIVNVVAEKGYRIIAADLCSEEPLSIVEQLRTVSLLPDSPAIVLFSSRSEAILLPMKVSLFSDDENDEKRNERIRSRVNALENDIGIVLLSQDKVIRDSVYSAGCRVYDGESVRQLIENEQNMRLTVFLTVPVSFEPNLVPPRLSELFIRHQIVDLVLLADRSHGDSFSKQLLNVLEAMKQDMKLPHTHFEKSLQFALERCITDAPATAKSTVV
jgi:signal transduction histidine kinase